MTNKSKAKGTAAETAVVNYLKNEWGLSYVERRALGGSEDRGDIAGLPGVVLEVKDAVKHSMKAWKSETLTEMENDGADICALIVKVPRKGVGEWDAWVPFWTMHIPREHCKFWVRMPFGDFVNYLKGEGFIS